MSKQFSDTELLSKEREDIFDLYYNQIENFKLELIKEGGGKENQPNYWLIEKGLTVLERNLDDLAKFELKQPKIVKLGNSTVNKMLKEWTDIFNSLGKRKDFIIDFTYNILVASAILSNIESIDSLLFRKYIKGLSPKREDRINYNNTFALRNDIDLESDQSKFINIEDKDVLSYLIKKQYRKLLMLAQLDNEYDPLYADILAKSIANRTENDIFESIHFDKLPYLELEKYRSLINSPKVISEIIKEREYPIKSSFEWEIKLRFDNGEEEYKANQISYSIWVMSEALEKIDGVSITLENSGIGSRWFKFKLKIKDELGKEEVKQVLNKSKEALEAQYLDKPIEEAKKLKAEREKVEKETKGIIDEKDAKKIRSLEIEKLELDNEATKVNIMKGKLEYIQGISKLIADGLILNDSNIQLFINDMLFIEKNNDSVKNGEDIELIEEDEIVIKPKTDDALEA